MKRKNENNKADFALQMVAKHPDKSIGKELLDIIEKNSIESNK
jgi:hypothetical protein